MFKVGKTDVKGSMVWVSGIFYAASVKENEKKSNPTKDLRGIGFFKL